MSLETLSAISLILKMGKAKIELIMCILLLILTYLDLISLIFDSGLGSTKLKN